MDMIFVDTLLFKVIALFGTFSLISVGISVGTYLYIIKKDKKTVKENMNKHKLLEMSDEEIINLKVENVKQQYQRSCDIKLAKEAKSSENTIAINNGEKSLSTINPNIYERMDIIDKLGYHSNEQPINLGIIENKESESQKVKTITNKNRT